MSAQKLLNLISRNKGATFSPQGLLTLEVPDPAPARLFESIHRVLNQIRA